MNKLNNNLQDIFLNSARKNKIPVTIHLVNGYQLKGIVAGFDSYTIVLNCTGKQILTYKHAVSSITPDKPILYTDYTNRELSREKE
jgi:host factor-I protein